MDPHYFELKNQTRTNGQHDVKELTENRLVPPRMHEADFEIPRLGGAVAPRNIAAALCDALWIAIHV